MYILYILYTYICLCLYLSLPLSFSPSHSSAFRPVSTLTLAIRSNTECHGHSLMFDPLLLLLLVLIPLAVVPLKGGVATPNLLPITSNFILLLFLPSPPQTSHPGFTSRTSSLIPTTRPLSPSPSALAGALFPFYRTLQPTHFHFLRLLRLFTSGPSAPEVVQPFYLFGPWNRGVPFGSLSFTHMHARTHAVCGPSFLFIISCCCHIIAETKQGGWVG